MRTKAIVIRKTPAGEYDQMVGLYSEDFGTMRAMARGVCRPTSVQSMHLELLNVVEFEVIHGRAWPIISSAGMIASHPGIRASLPKLAAAQFFTEVLDKIAFENERDDDLWNFLNTMLVDFDQSKEEDVLSLFRINQAKFLKVLGYGPMLDKSALSIDDFFEHIVGRKISALSFLYNVLK